jgi:hypothetical protein
MLFVYGTTFPEARKETMSHTYIRFERHRDNLESLTLGPFEYIQLTYDTLRVDNGDDLAILEEKGEGDWKILQTAFDDSPNSVPAWAAPFADEMYSDIIIFSSDTILNLAEENKYHDHDLAIRTSEELDRFLSPHN